MWTRIISLLLIAILLGGSITGCNTIRGFGRDVEKTGETVQDAAD
ncbi:MAG: entericidin A/B family lipoprotein [Dissulfuribacterales bacterium]